MNLVAFPNPADEALNIQVPEVLENGELSIVNLTGKTIRSMKLEKITPEEVLQVNLKAIPAGLYLIKIITESKMYTTRFVIVKSQ